MPRVAHDHPPNTPVHEAQRQRARSLLTPWPPAGSDVLHHVRAEPDGALHHFRAEPDGILHHGRAEPGRRTVAAAMLDRGVLPHVNGPLGVDVFVGEVARAVPPPPPPPPPPPLEAASSYIGARFSTSSCSNSSSRSEPSLSAISSASTASLARLSIISALGDLP